MGLIRFMWGGCHSLFIFIFTFMSMFVIVFVFVCVTKLEIMVEKVCVLKIGVSWLDRYGFF